MSEVAVPDLSEEKMIDVTPDGGVRKAVLQEGTGELPPKHARCLGVCPLRGCSWLAVVVQEQIVIRTAPPPAR